MGFLWFILAVMAALFFYWLRDNYRSLYGLSEIIVGLAILAARFLAEEPNVLGVGGGSMWGQWWFGTLTSLVGLFTGIYAIVRGLDNIIGEIRRS
jgi:hypothetical protein